MKWNEILLWYYVIPPLYFTWVSTELDKHSFDTVMCQLKASCITIFLRKQNTTSFSAPDNSLDIHDSNLEFMV